MATVDKQIVRNSAVLRAAPRRDNPATRSPPGTWVRVKAYDIPQNKYGAPPWLTIGPDHMFVEYDDGREQVIARGGPSGEPRQFVRHGFAGQLRTRAEVTPAKDSKDYGAGQRVMFETFVPHRTARDVARPAYDKAARVNRADNLYGAGVNSNSFAADVIEDTFGRRVGDWQTWGAKTRLRSGGMSPTMTESRKALGTGFGSTAPGQLLYRLAQELGKKPADTPMPPTP